ncbi:MAG TPA: flagellar hook-length control protein FliK [Methylotenera sp.]|nr:flagellar hook-length control protein FliK [Methylotenera sp.]HPH04975.1 flagellar hook-length control protein FliK [Methylotenera sp.]HPN00237.1 flagellar hook-length control protein FliK [Methylotenera sp.]
MMQKLSTVTPTVAPVNKSNGVDQQPNASAEAAQVPHAFQTLLKKQTQSAQQTNQKPAENEHKTSAPHLRQMLQAEAPKATTQGLSAKDREKEDAQATSTLVAIDSQQQKNEQLAAKAADEMVALLSVPVEAKTAQVDAAVVVEPMPENTTASEQAAAAIAGAMLAGNSMLNKSDSAQSVTQAASPNAQPQAVSATGLPAVSSSVSPMNVANAPASQSIMPTPEQSAFATQLNEAKIPMAASPENIMAPISAKLDDKQAINIATAMTGLQSGGQATAAVPMPVAPAQTVAGNMIEAKLGNTAWNQAISQRVVWMAGAGEQSATLTLNPPDLGPLQVVVQVHNGLADTTFTSDNADVRQALQDGIEHLREKMRESGVQLGQTNVQTGEQSRQDFQRMAEKNRLASPQRADNNPTHLQNNATTNKITRVTNGLVDTFA